MQHKSGDASTINHVHEPDVPATNGATAHHQPPGPPPPPPPVEQSPLDRARMAVGGMAQIIKNSPQPDATLAQIIGLYVARTQQLNVIGSHIDALTAALDELGVKQADTD